MPNAKPFMSFVPSPNHSDVSKKLPTVAIVNHIMSGTLLGTDSWFANPTSKASSHFGVGKNGEIHQYVDLMYPAWANGIVNKPNWKLLKAGVNPNYYTISIEHEGYAGEGLTEAQYQATLALHRWLIDLLKLPVNEDTIIGHYRIDSVNKPNCPSSSFPWTRLFKDLKGEVAKVKKVVAVFTAKDLTAGCAVSDELGGVGIFNRNGSSTAHPDVMSAEKVYTVGGGRLYPVGDPREEYMSGDDAIATMGAVAKAKLEGKLK